jgi:hypothetical protein
MVGGTRCRGTLLQGFPAGCAILRRAGLLLSVADATQESVLRGLDYVCSLRSLLTFGDFEFHLVSLLQALISFRVDRAVVNENIWSICAADEPVTFCVVKPLHGTFQAFHRTPFFRTPWGGKDVPQFLAALGCIFGPRG